MVDFKAIYNTQAVAYDRLVNYEDFEGNIQQALYAIAPPQHRYIAEFGAGTGRLTRLLAKPATQLMAFDMSLAMLQIAHATLKDQPQCHFAVADNRHLPLANGSVDIAIAGWSFGHSVGWYPHSWQDEIGQAIQAMQRILRPNGIAIILETLGTGSATPQPPNAGLAAYYDWLEQTYGFERTTISTDYRFPTPEAGAEALRFFFGDELADRILHDQLTILPEWTGIWSRHY